MACDDMSANRLLLANQWTNVPSCGHDCLIVSTLRNNTQSDIQHSGPKSLISFETLRVGPLFVRGLCGLWFVVRLCWLCAIVPDALYDWFCRIIRYLFRGCRQSVVWKKIRDTKQFEYTGIVLCIRSSLEWNKKNKETKIESAFPFSFFESVRAHPFIPLSQPQHSNNPSIHPMLCFPSHCFLSYSLPLF